MKRCVGVVTCSYWKLGIFSWMVSCLLIAPMLVGG